MTKPDQVPYRSQAEADAERRQTRLVWIILATKVTVLLILLLVAIFVDTKAHAQATADVPRAALQHRALLIRTSHAVWGLDAPVAVFAAQIHQESAWRPGAVSHVGAQGLAQFMPATARWIATTDPALAANTPFNPAWAMRALVAYDLHLYGRVPARFGPYDRMWLALRGYNGGEGHWRAEAATTGLRTPTRQQIDAACGQARRARVHCRENLGYPQRILVVIQPRYASWGRTLEPGA